jgi:hypothetical protein
MKKKHVAAIIAILLILIGTSFIIKQPDPWRPDQLMEPKDLAAIINGNTASNTLIINVGPAGLIKNAVDIGPTHEKNSLDKLRTLLGKEKRDRPIVIYCGCCPFEHCPNVRPAFQLLNEMKFTNQKLLNLTHNLKTDWINNGYPMAAR